MNYYFVKMSGKWSPRQGTIVETSKGQIFLDETDKPQGYSVSNLVMIPISEEDFKVATENGTVKQKAKNALCKGIDILLASANLEVSKRE